jgi:hypothetical protein
MTKLMVSIIVVSVVGALNLLSPSNVIAGCTIDQRIQLGNMGYSQERVDEVCSSSGGIEDILQNLLQTFGNEVASQLGKGAGRPFHQNSTPNPSPSSGMATMCATNYGNCPLQGAPMGYACYCRTWNGYNVPGVSR